MMPEMQVYFFALNYISFLNKPTPNVVKNINISKIANHGRGVGKIEKQHVWLTESNERAFLYVYLE